MPVAPQRDPLYMKNTEIGQGRAGSGQRLDPTLYGLWDVSVVGWIQRVARQGVAELMIGLTDRCAVGAYSPSTDRRCRPRIEQLAAVDPSLASAPVRVARTCGAPSTFGGPWRYTAARSHRKVHRHSSRDMDEPSRADKPRYEWPEPPALLSELAFSIFGTSPAAVVCEAERQVPTEGRHFATPCRTAGWTQHAGAGVGASSGHGLWATRTDPFFDRSEFWTHSKS
jgi:hypothetical protein